MKRKISVILSIIMVLACILTPLSQAADDKGFSDAVKAIKQKIDIPDDYKEIDSYKTTNDGVERWIITWNKDKDYSEGIRVCIDNTGRILSYNKYNYNKEYSISIPNISRQEAKKAAEEFINKMDSSYMGNIKAYENTGNYSYTQYAFTYYRLVNGIPFYNDGITLYVDSSTGEVTEFYCTWSTDLEFPSKDNIISQETAQANYKDKLGMRLVYKSYINYSSEDNKIKVFLAYEPIYGSSYCIDAKTGEVINSSCYGIYSNEEKAANKSGAQEADTGGSGIVLTPEEIAESDKYKNLLSKEEAENKARSIALLGIDSGYKLQNSSLMELWYQEGQYQWYLRFTKSDNENNVYSNISVQLDAATGELKSYYLSSFENQDPNAEPKYDRNTGKVEVEKFLKQVVPEKFNQTEYDNTGEQYGNMDEEAKYFNYTYQRKVNNILFPDNYLSVGFNAVTGKITSFTSGWYDIEIPKPDKGIIDMEKVYEKLFNDVGLQLQYEIFYTPGNSSQDLIYPIENGQNREVKIVYEINTAKPALFDAYTGDILKYDGSLYKEEKPITYDDITGCVGEKEILALADMNIGFYGGKFKPNENILQKDFMYLIAAAKGYNVRVTDDDEDQINNIYEYLKRMNIINEDEIDKNAPITREEAAKYIIRALGLEKAAQIKGIYKVNYEDGDKINEDLIGYVVLAEGLRFISKTGDNILPKNYVTRSEAAIMIYNYLKQ